MGDPTQYLPNCTASQIESELLSIGFPPAQSIVQLGLETAYHKVFRLNFSPSDHGDIIEKADLTSHSISEHVSNASMILRVSGSHIPLIKTDNEVGILTYLSSHTTVPVPQVIHYDNTNINKLRNEYMIMTLLSGMNGSDLYPSLTSSQLSHILDQFVDICLDLYKQDFNYIGGLKPSFDTKQTSFPQHVFNIPLLPGPPVLETMWQSPDIDLCFNNITQDLTEDQSRSDRQSFTTLNAVSANGYKTYTAWLVAQMEVYIHAITIHPSLAWVIKEDPNLTSLRSFTSLLLTSDTLQSKINSVPNKLAHRDLHFGNILLSPEPSSPSLSSSSSLSTTPEQQQEETQYKITGLLDWEFAAILPFPLWRHSFLWDGIPSPPPGYSGTKAQFRADSRRAQDRLYDEWKGKVRSRGGRDHLLGVQMLRDAEWGCEEQGAAWDVVNYLRCIVEVCPRGKQLEDAKGWWGQVKRALTVFGI